jgi:predicted house-cleaning noncanonical NTP pyrophosphatase (MazG superfamily)
MKKFELNKLIRNKLPARMLIERLVVHGKALSKEEYILQLKHKLLEEAEEVMQEDQADYLKIELADVLEVIHALAREYQISFEDIEQARLEKLEINGAFDQDSYINYIEVPDDNKKVLEYFLNKSKKYVIT